MLLSVYETAFVTGITPRHLYYLLEMSRIDGAFRIYSSWRIDESCVREVYERYNRELLEFTPADTGHDGLDARLETVRAHCLQAPEGSPFTRVSRRRRQLEHQQKRPYPVDSGQRIVQLELWADGNYW